MSDDYWNPMDPKAKAEGWIRGPAERWDVKGAFRVGYHTSINGTMKVRRPATIGRYCAIGDNCRFIASGHETQIVNLQVWLQQEVGAVNESRGKRPIEIGHNVWIGDQVIVLAGVTIGDGAIIGGGAIVTRDVEPFAIVAGAPATMKRYRFHENVRR
ncbi:DapH/DapD/GlmU-related protein [Acuticoccus mangrovi]|uniref:Acetyltransferase n=1 Tax=Acuticoccus mangrovi TaxID=2796142 RepID=A0A934IDH4_9HYPH|nr:DapH/DapD/GlmU-related protein [Acuticoccus mangrovi]MBJ3774544.1 hypothetical protein [Acuticoccus mangrovi]